MSEETIIAYADSRLETMKHIHAVREGVDAVIENLERRALVHDLSKLESPEKEAFDQVTPRLAKTAYGSFEYRATLREIKPALVHHYQLNDHHPEFYGVDGVLGMSLMAIVEMLVDWKAAGARHDPPTSLSKSINENAVRFNLPPYLTQILYNTARELEWE
jgi:hypothetical protein